MVRKANAKSGLNVDRVTRFRPPLTGTYTFLTKKSYFLYTITFTDQNSSCPGQIRTPGNLNAIHIRLLLVFFWDNLLWTKSNNMRKVYLKCFKIILLYFINKLNKKLIFQFWFKHKKPKSWTIDFFFFLKFDPKLNF